MDSEQQHKPQPQSLRMLNFDTVTCQYVDITKDGRTWHLRDDVPSEVMLRMFVARTLQSVQARIAERFEREQKRLAALQAAAEQGDAEAQAEALREVARTTVRTAAQDEVRCAQRETFDILGEIVRHTREYQHITTEELSGVYNPERWAWERGLFTYDEAQQICQLFSQLRSLAWLQQQNAPRPTEQAQEAAGTAGAATPHGNGSSIEELH